VATATTTATSGTVPSTWVTSAMSSPSSVAPGSTATITASVTSPSAATVLVDIEVYSAAGVKLHQAFFDGQAFSAGQQRTYPITWTVPAGTAAGTYTVMVGIFSPGWGTNYAWNGQAGTVVVTAGGDTTPPTISGIAVTGTTRTAATVNWTTNESATRRVEYGTTTALGQVRAPAGSGTSHAVGLSGLTRNTRYYYRIVTQDAAGNAATSSTRSFNTSP
jgi:hypothetical protein